MIEGLLCARGTWVKAAGVTFFSLFCRAVGRAWVQLWCPTLGRGFCRPVLHTSGQAGPRYVYICVLVILTFCVDIAPLCMTHFLVFFFSCANYEWMSCLVPSSNGFSRKMEKWLSVRMWPRKTITTLNINNIDIIIILELWCGGYFPLSPREPGGGRGKRCQLYGIQ